MKKLPIIVLILVLLLLPYFLFRIDLFNAKLYLDKFSHVAELDYENYVDFIKELVKIKKPDGYLLENNELYFKGNVYNVDFSSNFVVMEFEEEKQLIYVSNNVFFIVPKIKSYFIFFNNEYLVINEQNFAEKLDDIFPNVTSNITYYEGRKVFYQKVMGNGINYIVYYPYPKQHIMLYFVFIPFSVFIFYYFFVYLKKFEKEPEEKISKVAKALKILKYILENCENKDDFKDEIRELKRIFKGD
ncbi:hypothetical protein SU69_08990 [Thermosipho melanesiensis]|uniref:Ymf77 n=2 Tax=Thermosipho melanesiensis TaxID=46541 RepID=A6LNW4_THEM4|nr:hypothetical protein [Thermosipho melanesiensis]ABR31615.1 hypothetical protein Tmel_1780 [Thermosipho melanesiensis BI429]APT74952.1 hypothetical protein BW47_09370 [Thermosipho melanesiensis]OOC35143.1 hypothetical protein SU69_08990 [Thermosipho melanesiensis]OOC35353.1 hypothetical protein SU70_09000 [Thermosipho melanesiensis]OOC36604.1 hypothetical protein SU68_09060 [Thermosipho melanesiensis]